MNLKITNFTVIQNITVHKNISYWVQCNSHNNVVSVININKKQWYKDEKTVIFAYSQNNFQFLSCALTEFQSNTYYSEIKFDKKVTNFNNFKIKTNAVMIITITLSTDINFQQLSLVIFFNCCHNLLVYLQSCYCLVWYRDFSCVIILLLSVYLIRILALITGDDKLLLLYMLSQDY